MQVILKRVYFKFNSVEKGGIGTNVSNVTWYLNIEQVYEHMCGWNSFLHLDSVVMESLHRSLTPWHQMTFLARHAFLVLKWSLTFREHQPIINQNGDQYAR